MLRHIAECWATNVGVASAAACWLGVCVSGGVSGSWYLLVAIMLACFHLTKTHPDSRAFPEPWTGWIGLQITISTAHDKAIKTMHQNFTEHRLSRSMTWSVTLRMSGISQTYCLQWQAQGFTSDKDVGWNTMPLSVLISLDHWLAWLCSKADMNITNPNSWSVEDQDTFDAGRCHSFFSWRSCALLCCLGMAKVPHLERHHGGQITHAFMSLTSISGKEILYIICLCVINN